MCTIRRQARLVHEVIEAQIFRQIMIAADISTPLPPARR